MTIFLVDENLPRSLAPELRRAGFDAEDVRDRDLGISDLRRFPTGSELGIVLVRLPRVMEIDELNATLVAAVREVTAEDLRGSIVVVGPRRIRFRRTH